MNQAELLRVAVMCYWRFARGHRLVACEYEYHSSDVLSIPGIHSFMPMSIYETEIKVTLSDLKREKYKHKYKISFDGEAMPVWNRCDYFYFAMPETLWEKAESVVREIYPFAGVLVVSDTKHYFSDRRNVFETPPVKCEKDPRKLEQSHFNNEALSDLIRGMTNSLCSYGFRLAMAEMREGGSNAKDRF